MTASDILTVEQISLCHKLKSMRLASMAEKPRGGAICRYKQ